MALNNQKGDEWRQKHQTAIVVPDGPEELWQESRRVATESWVTVRTQSGNEGDEESVIDQAGSRASSFQYGANHRVPKGCQVAKVARKAPSNQDGNDGSQESAGRAPSDQQNNERPATSRRHSAVRRARLRRVLSVFRWRRSAMESTERP